MLAANPVYMVARGRPVAMYVTDVCFVWSCCFSITNDVVIQKHQDRDACCLGDA